MSNHSLFICLDGWSPDYLAYGSFPTLSRIQREGTHGLIKAVAPTVTNVNHVSILTGAFPDFHGITGNYTYDRVTGTGTYMESPGYITAPLLPLRLREHGVNTTLLTVKAKLCGLVGHAFDTAIAAENPPVQLTHQFGDPGSVYAPEANLWLFKALPTFLEGEDPTFVYLATTDWITHRYGPGSVETVRYFEMIDAEIGALLDRHPGINLCVTADHGMNDKQRAIDPGRILRNAGIGAVTLPIIKDRYVVHHQNLGGACSIFIEETGSINSAIDMLSKVRGVEQVILAKDAATRYHLPVERLGDIFLLGNKETVFGELDDETTGVTIRSHGSLHEQVVPFFGWGPVWGNAHVEYNKDLLTLFTD